MSYNASLLMNTNVRTETGKNVARRLRAAGEVPVTIYGGGSEPATAKVNKREFAAHIRAHGRATLFNLNLDGTPTPVKIADVQIDPVTSIVRHVDFVRLSLTEKSEFVVPIKIVGESQGVKLFAGILDVVSHSLKIRCLPTDLPDFIEVDVTPLGIGGHINAKHLTLPTGLELRTSGDATICTVVGSKAEEAPAATAEPEVAKKGKDAKKK